MIKKMIMYIRKGAQWVGWSTKYLPLVYRIFPSPHSNQYVNYQKGGESYDSLHQTVRMLRPILSTLASHVRTYATGRICINQAKQVLSFISSSFLSFPLFSLFFTLLLFLPSLLIFSESVQSNRTFIVPISLDYII